MVKVNFKNLHIIEDLKKEAYSCIHEEDFRKAEELADEIMTHSIAQYLLGEEKIEHYLYATAIDIYGKAGSHEKARKTKRDYDRFQEKFIKSMKASSP